MRGPGTRSNFSQRSRLLAGWRPDRISAGLRTPCLRAQRFSSVLGAPLLLLVLGFAFWLKLSTLRDKLTLDSDAANYLVTMNALFGGDPTGLGLTRPPLVGVPLKVFTSLFGLLTGIKVLGILVAVAIGIPFYLLARRFSSWPVAVATSFLFVFSARYSTMAFWGFLTLIGIFFGLLTLYLLLRTLERPSKRNILLTGLSASLLVGFHQVSATMFLPVVVVFLILYLACNPRRTLTSIKTLALVGLVASLLSLPYLPTYLLAGSDSASGEADPSLTFKSFQQGLDYLASFFPNSILTALLAATAFLGMVRLWSRDRNACLLLATLLLVPLLGSFLSLDSKLAVVTRRIPYLIYASLWLLTSAALSYLLSRYPLSLPAVLRQATGIGLPALALALTGTFLALEIPLSQRTLVGASHFYGYLDGALWSGVTWIRQNTQPDANLIVHPKPFGWWVEGAAQRNALETRDRWSFYETQRRETAVAQLALLGNQGLENGRLRVAVPYPFDGGTAIGVFLADQYQEVLLLKDRLQSKEKHTRVVGDGESMALETDYVTTDLAVVQSVQLKRGTSRATIVYRVRNTGGTGQTFLIDLDLNLGEEISWERVAPNTVQKSQRIRPGRRPIVTKTVITANGAKLALLPRDKSPNRLLARFELQRPEATITFRTDVVQPAGGAWPPVGHFSVPQLLEQNGINYLAVDTNVRHPLSSDLSAAVVGWLDQSPYLELVFKQNDVRIYRVDQFKLAQGRDGSQ